MIATKATVRQGKLVLDEPLALADGSCVEVKVMPPKRRKDPLLWLAEHAIDSGISDGAAEHDYYIYGTPKRNKNG